MVLLVFRKRCSVLGSGYKVYGNPSKRFVPYALHLMTLAYPILILHFHNGIVADHQTEGLGMVFSLSYMGLPADQAVFKTGNIFHQTMTHQHRMLNHRMDHPAVGAYGGVRTDKGVNNLSPFSDYHRSANNTADHFGCFWPDGPGR